MRSNTVPTGIGSYLPENWGFRELVMIKKLDGIFPFLSPNTNEAAPFKFVIGGISEFKGALAFTEVDLSFLGGSIKEIDKDNVTGGNDGTHSSLNINGDCDNFSPYHHLEWFANWEGNEIQGAQAFRGKIGREKVLYH